VLPPSTGHRVFGVPARLLTRVFVSSDVLTFFVQAAGSSVASSVEWVGPTANVGVKILIGGLALQAVMFLFFLAIFSRFVYLAKRKGLVVGDAPRGWEKVVVAVYVSSAMILVRCPLVARGLGLWETDGVGGRFVAYTASASSPRASRGMRFGMSGCFGCLNRCPCSWPLESLPSTIPASISAAMAGSRESGPRGWRVATRRRRRQPSCSLDIAGTGPGTEGSCIETSDLEGTLVEGGWRGAPKECRWVGAYVG
jgi:hypothetical protein